MTPVVRETLPNLDTNRRQSKGLVLEGMRGEFT